MEILLNPNIAYLLLVAGLLLAVLALVAPGTGILEIAALFILVLAGWGVSRLPVNYWALLFLLIGVFAFILALRSKRWVAYLVAAIIALVIGSTFLFRGEGWRPAVNPFLALVVSLLMSGFMWVAVKKSVAASLVQPEHDLRRLIGELGEAKTDIRDEGTVNVAGELWSARSDQAIPNGSTVRIVGREGFILEVEPAPQPAPQEQP